MARTTTNHPVIVVGVSGSTASGEALRWAADEARRRHAGLRIVRSWDREIRAPYAPADGRITVAAQRAAARHGLQALMREVFGSVTPDGVTAELAHGMAERTLVDLSSGADLLVLGSASPMAEAGELIGPVVRACLSHVRCPVVVVCAAGQPASPPRPDVGGRVHRARPVKSARAQPVRVPHRRVHRGQRVGR
jgi:nucleotide-binding universal stress UspA family protein